MKQETVEHDGHRIELEGDEAEPTLLIDGRRVRWGRFADDGQYFLYRHAYDSSESLVDAARRYLEYRGRIERRREVE